MEDRDAAFLFLGNMPTELVESADPGIRYEEFEKTLQGYLKEQKYPGNQPSAKLVKRLFKMTSFFLRRKKVLPQMRTIVNSRDWRARAKLLLRLSAVELPRMREKIIGRRYRSRSRAVALWTSRQLKALSRTLWFAFRVQRMESSAVRGLTTPPLDSQFLWDLRELLRDRMPRTSVADIDIIVAGCAVAAHIFSSEDANDVVSKIPMRISRANKRFGKQAARTAIGGLSPISPPANPAKQQNAGRLVKTRGRIGRIGREFRKVPHEKN